MGSSYDSDVIWHIFLNNRHCRILGAADKAVYNNKANRNTTAVDLVVLLLLWEPFDADKRRFHCGESRNMLKSELIP